MLLPFGSGTMVGSVVSVLLACELDVVVVTGRDAELVSAAVAPARTVYNERYASGLGTSIACGVGACPSGHSFLIALGDMPELSAAVVRRLVSLASADEILAPVYEAEPGRPGHPVLFGSSFRSELLALEGDEGARSVVLAHRDRLRLVPVSGGLVDYDS